jgi:hypothetical protein
LFSLAADATRSQLHVALRFACGGAVATNSAGPFPPAGRIEFLDPLLCIFLDAERPIVVGVELVVAAEGLASRVFALASSA